jgi:hypothetical protein
MSLPFPSSINLSINLFVQFSLLQGVLGLFFGRRRWLDGWMARSLRVCYVIKYFWSFGELADVEQDRLFIMYEFSFAKWA